MAYSDREIHSIREQWLPSIQSIAQTRGWAIHGADLEHFVDEVAPYLAHSYNVEGLTMMQVLHNFYNDAPLVKQLLEQDTASGYLWSKIATQIKLLTTQSPHLQSVSSQQRKAILKTFQAALQNHTYQMTVQKLLMAIITEAIGIKQEYSR